MYLRIYTYMYRINSLTYLVSCLLDRVTSWLLRRTSSPDFGICGIFQPCGLAEVFATSCLGYFREWSSKTCSLKSCRCGGGTGELICSCGYMRTYTHTCTATYIHAYIDMYMCIQAGSDRAGGTVDGNTNSQAKSEARTSCVTNMTIYLSIYLSIYRNMHTYRQTGRCIFIYMYTHTYGHLQRPTPHKNISNNMYASVHTYI